MGLLSGILTVGGAAIGGAFGGPAGAKLGATLGGAVGGAVSSSKGSSKATKAQLEAIAEGRRIAGEAKNEAIGYQQPYLDFGTASTKALGSRLGMSLPPARTAAGPNALTMGPAGVGYAGDPAGRKATIAASQDNSRRGINSAYAADDFGAGRRAAAGPDDGPIIDMQQGPGGTYEAAPLREANALTLGTDPGTYGSTANPTAPTPYTRGEAPATYQAPAYTAPEAPGTYRAPASFKFDVNDFVNSPILQAALKKGVDTAQSSTAAQGSLFSGATLKALADNALTTSYGFFDNERKFLAGRSDADRQFDYGVSRDARRDYEDTRDFGRTTYEDERDFGYGQSRDARRDYEDTRGFDYGLSRDAEEDYRDRRDYLTDRFDEQTNNLFRGVSIGQGAAGVASGAATRYGDQAVGLVTDAGEARARNALTQGQIGSDLSTGLGGVIAGAIGGGAGGVTRNALTMSLPDPVQFQRPANPTFVNTPGSIRI